MAGFSLDSRINGNALSLPMNMELEGSNLYFCECNLLVYTELCSKTFCLFACAWSETWNTGLFVSCSMIMHNLGELVHKFSFNFLFLYLGKINILNGLFQVLPMHIKGIYIYIEQKKVGIMLRIEDSVGIFAAVC